LSWLARIVVGTLAIRGTGASGKPAKTGLHRGLRFDRDLYGGGSEQKFPNRRGFERSVTKSLRRQGFRRLEEALGGVFAEILI